MNCIICLPIYNCDKYLNNIFINLLSIRTLFNNFAIVFGYDHCGDNSLKMLEEFKYKNNDICINILINNNKRFRYRTHNLAFIRNLMVEYIYTNYPNYELFIMMDSDDVCSKPIDLNILEKHLNNNSKWDSLSFNKNDYYDVWALQYGQFVHHFRSFKENTWPIIYFIKNDITNKLNNLKENEYFNVYSAFNGFAIYKTNKFVNCKYDGITQKYSDDEKIINMLNFLNSLKIKDTRSKIRICKIKENCEHISFHLDSIKKNNAQIMITKDILFI